MQITEDRASSDLALLACRFNRYDPRCITCWRRLRTWEADGTWERIWRSLLALLDELGKLEWATAFLDGSFVPAKGGRRGRKNQTW